MAFVRTVLGNVDAMAKQLAWSTKRAGVPRWTRCPAPPANAALTCRVFIDNPASAFSFLDRSPA